MKKKELAYHVTLKKNLEGIEENGITPRIGPRSEQPTTDGTPIESVARVYLFPTKEDLDTAMSNWLMDEFEDIEEYGLCYIEVMTKGLEIESDVEFEISTQDTIKPFRISNVYEEDWSLSKDWEQKKDLSYDHGMSY